MANSDNNFDDGFDEVFTEELVEDFTDDGIDEELAEDLMEEAIDADNDGYEDEDEGDLTEDDDDLNDDFDDGLDDELEPSGDASADEDESKDKKKKMMLIAAATAAIALVGGGAFLFKQLHPVATNVQPTPAPVATNVQPTPAPVATNVQPTPAPVATNVQPTQQSGLPAPKNVQDNANNNKQLHPVATNVQPASAPVATNVQPTLQSVASAAALAAENKILRERLDALVDEVRIAQSANKELFAAMVTELKRLNSEKLGATGSKPLKSKRQKLPAPKAVKAKPHIYSRPNYKIKAISQGEAWVYSLKTPGKVAHIVEGSALIGYGRVRKITASGGILTDAGYVNEGVSGLSQSNIKKQVKRKPKPKKQSLPVYKVAGIVDGTLWVYVKPSPSSRAIVKRFSEGDTLPGYGKIRAIYATGEVVAEKGKVRFEGSGN